MFVGHLGPIPKNSHFIGFVIPKIVEFAIFCIVIACLVPKLSYVMFFKIVMGDILDLEVKMFQN